MIKNARIDDYTITIERGQFLDMNLKLYMGNVCPSFGGWVLHKKGDPREFAGHHIRRIMDICEVEDLKDIIGKVVRVEVPVFELGIPVKVVAIGHFSNEDWYNPEEDFAVSKEDLCRTQ